MKPVANIKNQRVLLSPLNWGLGHVSRTIPIVATLLKGNNEVYICCNKEQEAFYRRYFPELWYIPHADYPFVFSGEGRWTLDLVQQFFPLLAYLRKERTVVEELAEKFNFDCIISDQRYGFYAENCKSIFITHQLNLPLPRWGFLLKWWNKRLINRFDELWIPDTENSDYAGKLSRTKQKNVHYIGVCSRFSMVKQPVVTMSQYRYLGIVSGPAPYAEQLFDLLCEKALESRAKIAIITPKEFAIKNRASAEWVELFVLPSDELFLQLIAESEEVISRSGYSTIMDLVVLGKKANLLPTKGQGEQEYLAKIWSKRMEEIG